MTAAGMATSEVVVTGLGATGPGARGAEALWQVVLDGKTMARHDTELEAAGVAVTISCRAPSFDADAELGPKASRRIDRYAQLALLAADEAAGHAGLAGGAEPGRLGIVLGTGGGGFETWESEYRRYLTSGPSRISPLALPKALANTAAGLISMRLNAQGPNLTVNTACGSGATALLVARDMIRSGAADVMVAGGVEAGITGLAAGAFAQMGALSRNPDPATASRPFDVDRDGFVLGEGAGVLILERADHARSRGARPLAVLAGAASSADAHHITAPPEDGRGARLAMVNALAAAGLDAADVGHVNAHGTSTPPNDIAEARAIRSVFGPAADNLAVSSTKGVTGHPLGAAGALEAVFSVLALRDQLAPPTANLEVLDPAVALDVVRGEPRATTFQAVMSNSFGFGGQNTVLLFTTA
jgi:3-oxoacyl-[acyl-carrier-protein] synthase II